MDFQRGPRHGRRHERARELRDVNFPLLNNLAAVAVLLPRKGHRRDEGSNLYSSPFYLPDPTRMHRAVVPSRPVLCLPCVGISDMNLTAKVPTCRRTNSTWS